MKNKLLILLLVSTSLITYANLPPTSSKADGESVFSTTFNTDYDTIPVTRSGATITIGTIPISKGGTNSSASLTNDKVITSVAGQIVESTTTTTQLGYLDATSSIQGQLDGKVVGPASASDNAITRYDSTTGKLVQNSLASVNDSGVISGDDYTFTDVNFNTLSLKSGVATIASTGVKSGGVISIGTPNTTVSISNGGGTCSSNTGTDSAKTVTWTGLTNQTLTFINTNAVTYLSIRCSDGALFQQVTPFTNTQSRDYIVLGAAIHTNLTNVNAVNQLQNVAISPLNQLDDLQRSLGFFNVSGNIYSANGANLNLNKSSGDIHKIGSNWDIDQKNPNVRTLASGSAITFRYRTNTGTEGSDVTSIDPDNYDNAGVVTTVPGNRYTIQRINVFSSNLTRIQYGQNLYLSLADAIAAIQVETFITESNIAENGLLRGFLVIRSGTTDLTDSARVLFLHAPKFGGVAGVGGLSTTTLQGAYNNSTAPQIVTNSTLGSFDVATGFGIDANNALTVRNNAGTVNFSVTGNGNVSGKAVDSAFPIQDSSDPTKQITFDAAGTTGTLTTLASSQTANRLITLPDLTTTLVGTTGAQTISDKTFVAPVLGAATGTSLTLTDKVDAKNLMNQLNSLTDPQVERATTLWGTYADAAGTAPVDGTGGSPNVTVSNSTSSPLRQLRSLVLVKDAVNRQGQGISQDFTIDVADQGKVLQASFDYQIASGTYADNDVSIWVYDITNARMIQPAPSQVLNTGIIERMAVEFQSAINSTSYRLIAHVSSTSALAYSLKFDNFSVGQQAKLYGSAVTDWTTFTPTGSLTTNATYTGKYRKIGDSLEVLSKVSFSGTNTQGVLTVNLPSGFSIDTSKLLTTDATRSILGQTRILDVDMAGYTGVTTYESTTSVRPRVLIDDLGTSSLYVVDGSIDTSTGVPATIASGDYVEVRYIVPIQGWSSSTIMSSDADTRVIAARVYGATTSVGTSDTTIIYPSVTFDTHASYNTSTGEYKVPVSGVYRVTTYQRGPSAIWSINEGPSASIYKNGVRYSIYTKDSTQGGGVAYRSDISGSVLVNAVSGDVLLVKFKGNPSAVLDNSGSESSWSTFERISGPAQIAASDSLNLRYTTVSGASITSSVATVLFGTRVFDTTGGAYNPATGVFTATSPGKYKVTVRLQTAAVTLSTTQSMGLYLYKAAAEYSTLDMFSGNGAAIPATTSGSDEISLLAGEQISIRADSSVSTTVSTNGTKNYLMIERIGNY